MDIFNKLKTNPDNPRYIKDEDFVKLKNSLRQAPWMLELRPLIYDKNFVVLGGNMRLEALRALVDSDGFEIKDEYFKSAEHLTEAEKREFIIKDNLLSGEMDWEKLGNEWEREELERWGLDTTGWGEDEKKPKGKKQTTCPACGHIF